VKVGYKARRGRRRRPAPHVCHRRRRGAISDPLTRAMKRVTLLRRLEEDERLWREELRDLGVLL
jgi:hypothetical protein